MVGPRQAQVHRKTSETAVDVLLSLDSGCSPSSAAPVGTARADAGAGRPTSRQVAGFWNTCSDCWRSTVAWI